MKKLIKILVCVLLVLAIVTSVAWYLFEYDTDFTRDLILQQAYRLEKNGNNAAAVWLYNMAYHQAEQNDSVAIELAEYYKSIGNYSKAEYTLTNAIEDGGGVELYIALCQTFVEQDKLRDAVMMLDMVSDPKIRAELDALRPQIPTASYPSGYYSQYIKLSIQAENAALYVADDQDYPSTATDSFSGELTLPGGESTYYAVSVGENGLVSPLAVFQYTIGGVVEEVIFADSTFAELLHQQLNIAEDQPIFSNDLWDVKEFSVPSAAITCEDLRWMPNLVSLTMEGCAFDDVAVIGQLTDLETLTITQCVISAKDLAAIASLPKLHTLTLSGCYLSNITSLASATNLTYLDLSDNSIRDLSALSRMTKLAYLELSHDAVLSLEAISSLTSLRALDVSYNSLASTAPVANLVNLTYLDISANDLMTSDVQGIESLTELTYFGAAYNNLTDIDFLVNSTKLMTLIISHNTLLDIHILSAHNALEYLDFSYNEVKNLPSFSKNCALIIINGNYNKLSSLDKLSVLQQLEYVYMDYNKGLKNVDKLANCSALKLVNIYGSSVTNVSKLTSKGIAVNYLQT